MTPFPFTSYCLQQPTIHAVPWLFLTAADDTCCSLTVPYSSRWYMLFPDFSTAADDTCCSLTVPYSSRRYMLFPDCSPQQPMIHSVSWQTPTAADDTLFPDCSLQQPTIHSGPWLFPIAATIHVPRVFPTAADDTRIVPWLFPPAADDTFCYLTVPISSRRYILFPDCSLQQPMMHSVSWLFPPAVDNTWCSLTVQVSSEQHATTTVLDTTGYQQDRLYFYTITIFITLICTCNVPKMKKSLAS